MSESITSADPGAAESQTTTEPVSDYDAVAQHFGLDAPEPESDEQQESDTPQAAEDSDEEAEKLRLKVNGKFIEKSLDEVKKLAQIQLAGESKLEQAKKEIEEARTSKANAERQVEAVKQLLGVLQKGDLDTIAEFATNHLNAGETFNRAVIQYALKLYEMSKMSPEQREALENKKLVERYKREAEERQRQDQERAMEYRVNQWSQHIATELPKAIKEVGLPDTDFVREQIISTWRTALEAGKTPTAQAVAAFVKQRLEQARMLGQPTQKAAPARPKATRESVGLKSASPADEGQYMSFEEWKKVRGRAS